jgi:hypothetical protein
MADIEWIKAPDSATRRLLERHPRVRSITDELGRDLEFRVGNWSRKIVRGVIVGQPFGLVELRDNNPMVCADEVGIPSEIGVLAMIGLGPLIEAGLLVEAPTMITNVPPSDDSLEVELAACGWDGGIVVEHEERDLRGVYAATTVAAIGTPSDLEEIDDLYEERFGRSFFIRRDETSEWDVKLVSGSHSAIYRLRISPDEPFSLLTIQTISDQNGKCGASQWVHTLNVMCGFEETLGLNESL